MELEGLKKHWEELNSRLEQADTQDNLLRAITVRERTADFRRRTERTMRIPMILALLLPLLLMNTSILLDFELTAVCIISMIFLVGFVVTDYTLFIIQLRRIDPLYGTVSETCRKIRRLRRHFLWDKAVKIIIVIPLILSLFDGFRHSPMAPFAIKGFWIGIAIGLPIGISLFIRIYTDLVDLERMFGDSDKTDF